MPSFVLPLTIDSRKIIFLDLEYRSPDYYESKNTDEDVYIIEDLHISQRKELVLLSSVHQMLSVHEDESDLPVSQMGIEADYDQGENILTLTIKKGAPGDLKKNIENFLRIERADSSLRIDMRQPPGGQIRELDCLHIKFVYSAADGEEYGAMIKLLFACRENVFFAGLDFGSEASQMIESHYSTRQGQLNIPAPTRLFTDIRKRRGPANSDDYPDDAFVQYDKDGPTLYKSVFYLKKQISVTAGTADTNRQIQRNTFNLPDDAIDFMTANRDLTRSYLVNHIQTPNLKLIHNQAGLEVDGLDIKIHTADASILNQTFMGIKPGVYRHMLSEMIVSFLEQREWDDNYLHFTILVPNIYNLHDIIETRRTIRGIVETYMSSRHISFRGLEISNLSESDASFLGSLTNINPEPGKYYLTIDCGKGTTDFSIIQVDPKDPSILRPLYRNGFAGAGNMINYAFLDTFIYYIKYVLAPDIDQSKIQQFFDSVFLLKNNEATAVKRDIFEKVENWKISHGNTSKSNVQTAWENAKDGSVTFSTWANSIEDHENAGPDLVRLIKDIPEVADWAGYIQSTVNEISNLLEESLSDVINHLNRKNLKCGGILLSGRAFRFDPLRVAVTEKLQQIKGLQNAVFIDTENIDLKRICLQGIFARNIKNFSDIVSTPIEVKRGTLSRATAKDQTGRYSGSGGFMKKFWDLLTNPDEEFLLSEDSFRMNMNITNFNEMQLNVGGKIYSPDGNGQYESADLIHSRKGFIIRATRKGASSCDIMAILPQNEGGLASRRMYEAIKKSMIPSIVDTTLLNSLK